MIQAVIFDCFGVLYGSSMWAQLEMCPPDKRQELLDNNKQNDYGYVTIEEYTQNVARLLGMTVVEVDVMFREKHVRNQRMFDVIAKLRARGFKTALLSNAGRNMPSALFSEQELKGDTFDAYMVSSEVGIVKPNPAIYTMIADKLGVPVGNCLMVDDTPENCEGAEIAGMQSIQYITFHDTLNSLTKILQQKLD